MSVVERRESNSTAMAAPPDNVDISCGAPCLEPAGELDQKLAYVIRSKGCPSGLSHAAARLAGSNAMFASANSTGVRSAMRSFHAGETCLRGVAYHFDSSA